MKKIIIILLVLIMVITNVSCSYEDINRVLFLTALIIDVKDEGRVVIYAEVFHSFRSNQTNSEKGEKLIYKEEGNTIKEALNHLDASSSQKIIFSQNKAIIFTENALKHGIGEFLDFLVRDQEFLVRPYVAVQLGDPEEFIQAPIKQNEYLGLFLFDIFDRPLAFLTLQHQQLFRFINQREMGQNISFMTVMEFDKNPLQDKIRKTGIAILQNDKLVTYIDAIQAIGFSFLMDFVNTGSVSLPRPNDEEKFFVVEILKSTTNSSLTFDGNKINLKKSIKTRVTLDGVQDGIRLNEIVLEEMEQHIENFIKNECESFFHLFKEQELDVLGVQESFKRRYPNEDVENPIAITELEVEVDVFIEGSSGVTNFNTQRIRQKQ